MTGRARGSWVGRCQGAEGLEIEEVRLKRV